MADPNYQPVTINKSGGNVILTVSCPDYPQSISGTTEEYTVLANLPVNTYSFSTAQPQTTLGMPAAINQHYYAVDGAVLNQNDDPPTQYQVQILITQDGKQLALFKQPANGPGEISNADQYFLCKFQLVAA